MRMSTARYRITLWQYSCLAHKQQHTKAMLTHMSE